MGQLTNLYVSSSYQGLLKMTDSTNGLTSTLQTVQTGDGDNSPLQMSLTQVNISGSLTVNGSPISVDTGSLVTKTEFNNYTGSNDARVNSLIAQTGSYVTETESGSFVTNVTQPPFIGNRIDITKGNGSFNTITINNVTNATSASFAQNAVSSSFATNAATASIANDIIVYGKCNNPAGLTKGTIVRIVGANGDNPLFDTASWIDDANSANTLGMLTADVAYNAFTNIVTQGTVLGINTNGMTAGQMLYLSSSGQYTNVIPPAPYHEVRLGQVLRPQLNNGSAYISVDNGYELTELHDVDITNPVNGDLLVYRSGSYGQWVNEDSGQLGFATTGSNNFVGQQNINGSVNVTGSLNVTGEITALSASITYLETIYQTSSIIFSSGSNILGDEAGDTQTLYGTVKLPNGPLSITGSLRSTGEIRTDGNVVVGNTLLTNNIGNPGTAGDITINPSGFFKVVIDGDTEVTGTLKVTGGITGSLEGTASFATNALSASWAPDNSNRDGLINTGSAASVQSITGSVILSGSAGVELDVKGDQLNTGSITIRSGSLSTLSNNTIDYNNYLTSSVGGQSNQIKGWSDSPAFAGPGSVQSNFTGSLRIAGGSNNTVSMPQIRATALGGGSDQQGYISGSDNMILSNNAGMFLNTGSLIFPRQINNILTAGSAISMNFTTSSLAGNPPAIQNNFLLGGTVQINSNSGSLSSLVGNLMVGGIITSNQNFVTNQRPLITGNNVIGTVTLNHISSSINYQANYNNSPITINNHLSSSITNNSLNFINNAVFGGSSNLGLGVWVSGSQSSNIQRQISDNLIGGRSNIISSSFVSSSNSNLFSTIIYGNSLIVSGSHNTGTNGGSAYFGRFNDTGSSVSAQNTVFAVGSGTGAAARRTSLWVDNNGVTNVSGALSLEYANDATTGSLALMTARNGTSLWFYNKTTNNTSWGANNNAWQVGGSFGLVSGSVANAFYGGYAGQGFRSGSNNIMFNSTFDTFVSGSNNLFIGQSNNGLAGGDGNVIIGPISYPSGSIVNNRFQINQAGGGGAIMTKDGTAALQISDDVVVTGSINISSVMNLTPQNPLPTGNIGDLAVSSSNQLYFYNGAWTLIV